MPYREHTLQNRGLSTAGQNGDDAFDFTDTGLRDSVTPDAEVSVDPSDPSVDPQDPTQFSEAAMPSQSTGGVAPGEDVACQDNLRTAADLESGEVGSGDWLLV